MKAERQFAFPGEDLSNEEGDRFFLLLSDEDMLRMMHEKAETFHDTYRAGHELAIQTLLYSEQFSHNQLEAISYGMSVQEAASSLSQTGVEAQTREVLQQPGEVRMHVVRILGKISSDPFNKIDELDDQFRERNPVGSDLIGELAEKRFNRRSIDDAIGGAALTRYIELEVANGR